MSPESGILISANVAAATAVAGYDLLQNERKSVSSRGRAVTGLSIVGGNAINEATIDVYAGDFYFGPFNNTHAGAVSPIMPDDLQPVRPTMVAPGDKVTATVRVAPTVSPILIRIHGYDL